MLPAVRTSRAPATRNPGMRAVALSAGIELTPAEAWQTRSLPIWDVVVLNDQSQASRIRDLREWLRQRAANKRRHVAHLTVPIGVNWCPLRKAGRQKNQEPLLQRPTKGDACT